MERLFDFRKCVQRGMVRVYLCLFEAKCVNNTCSSGNVSKQHNKRICSLAVLCFSVQLNGHKLPNGCSLVGLIAGNEQRSTP
jgi:hypothetical protein